MSSLRPSRTRSSTRGQQPAVASASQSGRQRTNKQQTSVSSDDDDHGELDQDMSDPGDRGTASDNDTGSDDPDQYNAAVSVGSKRQQHCSRHAASDSDESQEEDDEDQEQLPSSAARACSHAAAEPGPSSRAAAASKLSTKQRSSNSKKRTAQVAYADAITLLPSDLDEEMLIRTRQKLQPRHRMQKQALMQQYRLDFPHWRFLLRQHFSILFYGFGSKRNLLETFAEEALTDGGVLACNGLNPGMNSKQILQAVASALTHRNCKSHSHSELLSLIVDEPACRQLYLVLHNIDGPGLRSAEDQLWLSRLSQAPAVRLMASVDHVNAPLLWSSRVAAAFNWLWVDVTSYAGYDRETSGVAPIITSCKASAAKRGAATVLSTLPSSAREVFKVLAAQQLEDPSAAGISFPLLLRMVRERFILNSEQALKSVLTEFRDHELIKFRPGPDGSEVMYIPNEPDMIRQTLQDMEQEAS